MKVGFFITARLKSSRLKQKILLDLNGKSVIDRVIERAKNVKGVDGIVLCTSTNPQDSILYNNALSNEIQFYAGSEDDVLKRLLDAAKYFGYDGFVSITADNPLFSIYTSSLLVDLYKRKQYDFINTKGLPIGCGTYLLDVKTLEIVNFIKKQSDTEIWGPFINRPDFFNVAELIVKNSPIEDNLRITLDYPEDYKLIRRIYKYYKKNQIPSLIEILELLKENPDILNINSGKIQLDVPVDSLNRINTDFEKNIDKARFFAKSIGKQVNSRLTRINLNI